MLQKLSLSLSLSLPASSVMRSPSSLRTRPSQRRSTSAAFTSPGLVQMSLALTSIANFNFRGVFSVGLILSEQNILRFKKIFNHDAKSGVFTDAMAALDTNSADPTQGLYSIMNTVACCLLYRLIKLRRPTSLLAPHGAL